MNHIQTSVPVENDEIITPDPIETHDSTLAMTEKCEMDDIPSQEEDQMSGDDFKPEKEESSQKPVPVLSSSEAERKIIALIPHGSNQQQSDFYTSLFKFLSSKRKLPDKIPVMGFKALDLYNLYRLVIAHGGYDSFGKDAGEASWMKIFKQLDNYRSTITNSSVRLRKYYEKYLLEYERKNFIPDPEKIKEYRENEEKAEAKKKKKIQKEEEEEEEMNNDGKQRILLTFDGKTTVSAEVAASDFSIFVTCQLPLAVFAERRPDETFWQWTPASKCLPKVDIENPREYMTIGELMYTEDGCILIGNGQPMGTRVSLEGIKAILFATCRGDVPTPYKNQQCWINDPNSTDTGSTPQRKKKEIIKKPTQSQPEKVAEKRPRPVIQDVSEKNRIKKKEKMETDEETSISIKYKYEGETDNDSRLIKTATSETNLTPQLLQHMLQEDNVLLEELTEIRYFENSDDESGEGWALVTNDFLASIEGRLRIRLRLKKGKRDPNVDIFKRKTLLNEKFNSSPENK